MTLYIDAEDTLYFTPMNADLYPNYELLTSAQCYLDMHPNQNLVIITKEDTNKAYAILNPFIQQWNMQPTYILYDMITFTEGLDIIVSSHGKINNGKLDAMYAKEFIKHVVCEEAIHHVNKHGDDPGELVG